ncbi:hypothetical protein DPMN_152904 [Dreissena polymorpha]|uniref:Methyltransferase domain-containing protein n=1 Tax=Dreissena polymorpha TaxID=45954 RepID=A0A9D4FI52_DREPO|nr:hypothetical protein DPMN_152904 [Dreissena polymorpha]
MAEQKSLPTASEGDTTFNFNGVFRDVHNKSSRDNLYQAQAFISENKWNAAKDLLQKALSDSSDDHDVRNLKLVIAEVDMYLSRAIPEAIQADEKIDWDQVNSRGVHKYFENREDLPQSVFFLRSNQHDRIVVGRRILSHQYINNKIRELHCSHITASMLLGRLVDQRTRETGYAVYYNQMTAGEKLFLIDDVLNNGMNVYELVFPFPPLIGQSKEEIQSPEEGWEIDEKLALSLGEGEVYIRDYAVRYLKSLGRDDLRLFDCACSTGQFLFTMKQGVPGCYTIGSDLSAHMVEFAKKRVDEIYCANALEPKIPPRSVDVVFVRFINSEVVKTEIASIFLKPLTECLKKGGKMIILGHTPVLTSAAEIKMLVPNLEITQSIGGISEWNGIFQFYVCSRID